MKRAIIVACVLFLFTLNLTPGYSQSISKENLIEDTRHLARTIESVHPDPYIKGGGKIAFHRRFQKILYAIPASGMTKEEFYSLIRPFIAGIGDGHTAVYDPHTYDPYSPGGIPLYFETAANGLFVFAALQEDHRRYLGARLESVEGITFQELVERQNKLMGADNVYFVYQNLGRQGVLWNRHSLAKLIPEWLQKVRIKLSLRLKNGELEEPVLTIPFRIDYASFIYPQSTLPIMSDLIATMQRTDLFYRFFDSTRQTCLLVIHDLSTYREAFEIWQSLKVPGRDEQARLVYQRYHGSTPPDDIKEVIAGLPSATELFRSMIQEMKEARTENLIIDLSQNSGGNSLLSDILVYFLYGKEKLLSLQDKTVEVIKYSPEYFENFPSPALEEINSNELFPLAIDDYDLTADYAHRDYPGKEYLEQKFLERASWMPTFQEEYQSSKYSRYYLPDKVMALCDAGTFSSAFTMMYYLKQVGAEIIGIPSAQAGNCFGDILSFELPNSGLKYSVSRKYFELFPEDNEKGKVLLPDHLLTYDIMASYNFDPASLLLFTLDILKQHR